MLFIKVLLHSGTLFIPGLVSRSPKPHRKEGFDKGLLELSMVV